MSTGTAVLPPKIRILGSDKLTIYRFCLELANEIGGDESLVLLQLQFIIEHMTNPRKHLRDGEWWCYFSVRDLQATYFSWLSKSTIDRILKKLFKKGLIKFGNYNKRKNDKTRWIALNREGISQLKALQFTGLDPTAEQDTDLSQNGTPPAEQDTDLFQNGTVPSQNGTASPQNGTSPSQNGTEASQNGMTLPENQKIKDKEEKKDIKEEDKPLSSSSSSVDTEKEKIFKAFAENITDLTPINREVLEEWLAVYQPRQILYAIRETAGQEKHKRNRHYVAAILKKRDQEGWPELDETGCVLRKEPHPSPVESDEPPLWLLDDDLPLFRLLARQSQSDVTVEEWLEKHPDHPDAAAIRERWAQIERERKAFREQMVKAQRGDGQTRIGDLGTVGELWAKLLHGFEIQLDKNTYDTWLAETFGAEFRAGRIYVGVRNAFQRDMLAHRLYPPLRRVASEMFGQDVELTFCIDGVLPETPYAVAADALEGVPTAPRAGVGG